MPKYWLDYVWLMGSFGFEGYIPRNSCRVKSQRLVVQEEKYKYDMWMWSSVRRWSLGWNTRLNNCGGSLTRDHAVVAATANHRVYKLLPSNEPLRQFWTMSSPLNRKSVIRSYKHLHKNDPWTFTWYICHVEIFRLHSFVIQISSHEVHRRSIRGFREGISRTCVSGDIWDIIPK